MAGRIGQRLLEHGQHLVEDVLVLGKSTRLDLGPGSDLAGRGVADHDDRDEALVAQDATVLQQSLGGLAHGRAVDVDVSAGHRTDDARDPVDEVDNHTVLSQNDASARNAGLDGQLGVGHQVTPLPVHRHDVARFDDVVAVEKLSGAGVAGDVNLGVALVHDIGAKTHQAVDDAIDGVLVSGDQRGSKQDGVAHTDLDLVVPVGHSRERGHRLTLGAGADEDDLVVRIVRQLLEVDHHARRHLEETELLSDAHVAQHRPADHGDLATVGVRRIENLLDAVDVGGEAGDDDPASRVAEYCLDRRRELAFRGRETRHLGVGGVGHEQIHALFTEPGEGPQIRDPTVERQLVHLEVTGVQDGAARGADEDRQRVRNRVVDSRELAVEDTDLLALTLGDGQGVRLDLVFLQLGLDHRQRQRRTDQRDVGLEPQKVRHGPDVVLMTMREHDRLDVIHPLLDVLEVRQDQVDPGVMVLREEHPAVDDQQPSSVLDDGHVAANLAQTTERDDAYGVLRQPRG